jgi:RNA polymerase sigma factor (sigma-70 family)
MVAGDPLFRVKSGPGQSEILAELFSVHRVRLMGLAAAVMLDRSAAADVVQEAFAGLAPRLDSVERPEAYLQRSVVNLAIAVVRERERSRGVAVRPLRHSAIPEIDEAWDRIAGLSAQQRAVVVLRFWEDLTQEQIAAVLSLPLGTVKSTLHRALRTLRANWPTELEANR